MALKVWTRYSPPPTVKTSSIVRFPPLLDLLIERAREAQRRRHLRGKLGAQRLLEHLRALNEGEGLVEACRGARREPQEVAPGLVKSLAPFAQAIRVRPVEVRARVHRHVDEAHGHGGDEVDRDDFGQVVD